MDPRLSISEDAKRTHEKRSQSAWKENKQNFEHAEMFVHTHADAINEKMKAATIEAEKAEAKAIEA